MGRFEDIINTAGGAKTARPKRSKAVKPVEEPTIEELYDAHKHAGQDPVMREEKNRVDERGREEMKRGLEFEEEGRYEEIRKIAQEIHDGRKAADPSITREIPTTADMEMAEKIYEGKLQQSADAEDKLGAPEVRTEDARQAELNQVINDLTAKAVQIEDIKKKKGSKFASLAKSLGIRTRSLENDEEIVALKKEGDDLYRSLMAKGIKLYWNDAGQLENFMKEYGDKDEFYLNLTDKALDEQAKNLPEKAVNYFYKIGERWSKMKWWQKSLVMGSAGLLTGGGALAIGYGTFGAFALSAGSRYTFRGFGAIMAGIGKKISLEKQRTQERDASWQDKFDEQMGILKQYEHDLDAGIALVINQENFSNIGKNYEEKSLQNTRQALKFAGKAFAYSTAFGETLRVVGQETGINFGSILKKIGEQTGMSFSGVKESIGNFLGGHQPSVEHAAMGGGATAAKISEDLYTKAPDGKYIITPKGAEALEGGPIKHFEGAPELPGDDKEILRNLSATAEPEVKGGGIVPEPEAGGGAGKTYAEAYSGTENADHLADFKEIASGKVGAGGSIEKISNNVLQEIKKNPAAYGLDPNDPDLSAKAEGLRKGMIEEFFKKKGFDTYEEFDKYVRSGSVRENDKFWINWDSNEGKFRLGYEGKNMRPDLIQIISGDEVAGGKAGVAPEEMRPKAGAGVAEQPPARASGAGKYKLPDEILENERIAKKNFAMASEYQQTLDQYHKEKLIPYNEQQLKMANLQQFISTRGLANNIVEDAGIGKRANFWGQPMSKFNDLVGENLFAGEASEPDAVDKINSNKDRLRRLFEILKNYSVHGGETMDECLRKAITDPTPIRGGKLGESIGSRVLQLINQKVLGK